MGNAFFMAYAQILVFSAFFFQATLSVAASDDAASPADQSGVAVGQEQGPVTGHPLPRFVSLKASKGNARRGPSTSHRIDWLFQVAGMPLEVIAEHRHWRRVRFHDGSGGWMHYALLSGVRTVVVMEKKVPLRVTPSETALTLAYAEPGAVAKLGKCDPEWCRIASDQNRGWVKKIYLWGVYQDEIR